MCGQFYLDTMHADRSNLILQYLSIQWSDLEAGNTVATVRISRSFLWYAMNELVHTMQEQIDACDARTKWCMWCKNELLLFFLFSFLYMDGYSSHLPWLNYGCKIECLQSPLRDDYLEDLIHREIFKDNSSSFIGTLETVYPFYDKAKWWPISLLWSPTSRKPKTTS